jgi:drug/metabolite transporter (DMT)-like permease
VRNDTRLGIWLMIATCAVFSAQDGISRHLGEEYSVFLVVMIRYWFFALFVIALVSRAPGGLRAALGTRQKGLQAARGLILAAEICITVLAFILLGLVASHAIFAAYPLIVAALSGPVLGEKVGWRRWAAIGVGMIGILIILRPGTAVFTPAALVALLGAFTFAVYSLMTRYAARQDPAMTSFFWTGVMGAIAMTPLGLWHWQPMTGPDAALMAVLCLLGATGHFLLIKCYEVAEASAVQPFAYFQLVFIAIIGVTIFDEVVEWPVILGAAIVVGAGLFTLWRERVRAGRA